MADDDELKQFVKLVSADGHEFFISRRCAMVSATIKSMLSGPGMFFSPKFRFLCHHFFVFSS
jgi:hypothetical protein